MVRWQFAVIDWEWSSWYICARRTTWSSTPFLRHGKVMFASFHNWLELLCISIYSFMQFWVVELCHHILLCTSMTLYDHQCLTTHVCIIPALLIVKVQKPIYVYVRWLMYWYICTAVYLLLCVPKSLVICYNAKTWSLNFWLLFFCLLERYGCR